MSAADTTVVVDGRFLLAQSSYPAPLTTTTSAACNVFTSLAVGSKSWASAVVDDRIDVTFASSPPICAASEPHWLSEATTVSGPDEAEAEAMGDASSATTWPHPASVAASASATRDAAAARRRYDEVRMPMSDGSFA